jgi:hypothetical protein
MDEFMERPGDHFGWYQIVDEAPLELVRDLPAPATGKFVMITDPEDVGKPEPGYLGLLWDLRDGGRIVERTCGYVMVGVNPEDATWLPLGWRLSSVVPIGWELPHLERWFDIATANIEGLRYTEYRGYPPEGLGRTPLPRDWVAAAFMIVRHLGLPGSPREPRTTIDRAGCVAELMDVLEFLREAMVKATKDIPPGGEAKTTSDGIEREGLLRWRGRSHRITGGVHSRLIKYMWDKQGATFEELIGPVFDSPQGNGSMRTRVAEVNDTLKE